MKPKLMAILNLTPDSFYDGNPRLTTDEAIEKGVRLIDEGADILDIGAESSRPGSKRVTEEEELSRLLPVLQGIRKRSKALISIDTMKPNVAKIAFREGASILNDITGLENREMQSIVAETGASAIIMHMLKMPETMQENPHYPFGIVKELLYWFRTRLEELEKAGISLEKLWIDPGIGFGKTVADNLEILQNLPKFSEMGLPLVVGLSRKSFMQKILNKPASELLAATLSMNALALVNGASVVRVHDVKEHRDMIDLLTTGFLPL